MGFDHKAFLLKDKIKHLGHAFFLAWDWGPSLNASQFLSTVSIYLHRGDVSLTEVIFNLENKVLTKSDTKGLVESEKNETINKVRYNMSDS